MFRFVTIDEFIDLKCKYPDKLMTLSDISAITIKYPDFSWFDEMRWGLKQAGTLLCVDYIEKLQPEVILEVGAGFNTFFDNRYGTEVDYWMLDDPGFYDQKVLKTANS